MFCFIQKLKNKAVTINDFIVVFKFYLEFCAKNRFN